MTRKKKKKKNSIMGAIVMCCVIIAIGVVLYVLDHTKTGRKFLED
jgi:flagellar basal body-associated protein FliL